MAYIFGLKQATKLVLSLLHSPLTTTSIRVNKSSCTGLCWLIQTLFQQVNIVLPLKTRLQGLSPMYKCFIQCIMRVLLCNAFRFRALNNFIIMYFIICKLLGFPEIHC